MSEEPTPGPWTYTDNGEEITIDCGEIYGAAVLWAGDSDDWPHAQQLANARLIAAAPQLLEACIQARAALPDRSLCESGGQRSVVDMLNAAIAAAEGKVES